MSFRHGDSPRNPTPAQSLEKLLLRWRVEKLLEGPRDAAASAWGPQPLMDCYLACFQSELRMV